MNDRADQDTEGAAERVGQRAGGQGRLGTGRTEGKQDGWSVESNPSSLLLPCLASPRLASSARPTLVPATSIFPHSVLPLCQLLLCLAPGWLAGCCRYCYPCRMSEVRLASELDRLRRRANQRRPPSLPQDRQVPRCLSLAEPIRQARSEPHLASRHHPAPAPARSKVGQASFFWRWS